MLTKGLSRHSALRILFFLLSANYGSAQGDLLIFPKRIVFENGKKVQTVSLANIEDASYHQGGIIPTLLDYGSIRLSTEGDETTYRFAYVTHPKQEIALLNNAIEAFKNGRPIEEE